MTSSDIVMDRTAGEAGLATRRPDTVVWAVVAGMAWLLAAMLWKTGLSLDTASNPALLIVAACYALLTCFYVFVRKIPVIADALILFGQITLMMILGLLLSYAVSAIPLPYRDVELHAFDLSIGFYREAYLKFLVDHPRLLGFVYLGYASLLTQFVVVPFALVLSGQEERCRTYGVAYGLSLTVTCIIAAFVPATNALVHVDLPTIGYGELSLRVESYFPTLEALRTGVQKFIPLCDFEGLISFPSFHTVSAILYAWALWPLARLRWLSVPLNLLMILGTPGFGAHYIVDVIAGVVVAILSIIVAAHIRGRQSSFGQVRP
jgi:membrane-associated phospholipid phosphatase